MKYRPQACHPCLCLAILTVLALTPPVRAGIIFVPTRAELAGNDLVDWGGLGATAPNPFSITSAGGHNLTVSLSGGFSPGVFGHGVSAGGAGTFPAGSDFIDGPGQTAFIGGDSTNTFLTLAFEQPIRGGGLDIDAFVFGNVGQVPLAAVSIEALTASGSSLGTFHVPIEFRVDGPPVFLGVLSDQADIALLRFSAAGRGLDTGRAATAVSNVNEVSLVHDRASNVASVPEPSSLSLFGVGLLALLGYGWRRQNLSP